MIFDPYNYCSLFISTSHVANKLLSRDHHMTSYEPSFMQFPLVMRQKYIHP